VVSSSIVVVMNKDFSDVLKESTSYIFRIKEQAQEASRVSHL
jgi:hypothetical protein